MSAAMDLLAEGQRRLLAQLRGLQYGTAQLTVHVYDGRAVRIEVVRSESVQVEKGEPLGCAG